MTPAARLQAVIDLTDIFLKDDRSPADGVLSDWFRNRRFIGSKDRSAIAQRSYDVLRAWGRLNWHFQQLDTAVTARLMVATEALLQKRELPQSVMDMFSGDKFAPQPLWRSELEFLDAITEREFEPDDMPQDVRLECPPWAAEELRRSLGDGFEREMQAALTPAQLHLRSNPLKASRSDVMRLLRELGALVEPGALSPHAIIVRGRPPVQTLPEFRDGWFEIQDEGSQLIGLLTCAEPGMHVMDFCAGAGGKTLALAAAMQNKGRIVATDVLSGRLQRLKERARRAGLNNLATHALSTERDPWLKRHKGRFDRVLVDAPCTGTGTWKRNPDARWRRLGPGTADVVALQQRIIDSAARLVKPGGRLIYATCSLFASENEGQVDGFLARHPGFRLLPVADLWPKGAGPCPFPADAPYMRLSPATHGTDGFFTAVLERSADAPTEPEPGEPEPADADPADTTETERAEP